MLGRMLRWLFGDAASAEGRGRSVPPSEAAKSPDEPIDTTDEVVKMPIEASIDLHHFHPRDIPSVVDEYLRAARDEGFVEVRVIHGRGRGIQRQRVQRQLAKDPRVVSFASDGLGSTRVVLTPRRKKRA